MAIEDVVAFVGHERLSVGLHARADFRSKRSDLLRQQHLGERNNFHRQRKLAQHGHLLGGIGHEYQAARCRRHNFFAQQRATAALNRPQFGIHLVGTINGDINLLALIKRQQRNAQAYREVVRAHRSRNAVDLQPGLDAFAEKTDEIRRRRA